MNSDILLVGIIGFTLGVAVTGFIANKALSNIIERKNEEIDSTKLTMDEIIHWFKMIETPSRRSLEILEKIEKDIKNINDSKKAKLVNYTNAIKESFGEFTKEFLERVENTVNEGKDENND